MLEIAVHKQVHAGLRLEVDLEVGVGCTVVFGRSGAGKSTLLGLISGTSRPDGGRVRLDGRLLFDQAAGVDLPLRDRGIGMIFQRGWLFPHLNVAKNVAYGVQRWRRERAEQRVEQVARLCGIIGLMDRKVATLSGGEAQRVGLARALAPGPRVLLCDEPFSALDVRARVELVSRLRDVRDAEEVMVIFVTHSPSEAVMIGDRLARMENGRIVATGRPLEVLAEAGLGAPGWSEPVWNILEGVVEEKVGSSGALVRLKGVPGVVLRVVDDGLALGQRVKVGVRADDILLASGSVDGLAGRLSARNLITGRVDQMFEHDGEVEVLVRTGEVGWTISVVSETVRALDLREGTEVVLVIKSRGCQVLGREG